MACSYTGKLCACVSAQNCRCPRCWRLIWNQFPFTKHQPAPLGKRNKVDADQQSRALRQIFDIFPVTNHSEYKQLFVVKCLSYLGVFIVSSHRLNPSDRLSKVNWGSNIMAACHSQTRFIFPQWSSGKSPLRHAPCPFSEGNPVTSSAHIWAGAVQSLYTAGNPPADVDERWAEPRLSRTV